MPWLIVLGDAKAAEWVLKHGRMAFGPRYRAADALKPGEAVAIYVSRGAFYAPKRDEAQIVAIGRIASSVVHERIRIADREYEKWCDLSLDVQLPLRQGLAFRPLVEELEFISNKQAWPGYVQRALVRLPERDFERIRNAFMPRAQG